MLTESLLIFSTLLIGTLAFCVRPIDEVRAEEHYNRGVNFLKAGRHELAIAEFQLSLELRPTEIDTHLNLGNAFAANKQFEDAILEWQTCIKLDPAYARAYFNMGTLYRTRHEYTQALNYFKTYVGLIAIDKEEVRRVQGIMKDLRQKIKETQSQSLQAEE